MKTIRHIVAAAAAVYLVGIGLGSAASLPKWGEIIENEKTMPPPARYPTAEAVVLFDIGQLEVSIDPAWIRMKRHVRIKIFNKNAAGDVATVELPTYKGDHLTGLKAQTIGRDGRRTEVKHIFRKKAEGVIVITFTFPAVEDGAILEYEYTQSHQRFFFLDPWLFQTDVYTVYSRLALALQPGFTYNVMRTNLPGDRQEPVQEDYTFQGARAGNYIWELRDLMPVKHEPLASARLDNMISLQFQLVKYENEYGTFSFARSWEELGEAQEEEYRVFLRKTDILKRTADSLCAGSVDIPEKTKRLYDFVHDRIETKDQAEESDEAVNLLKDRRGTAIEKNLLLVGLLRTQDISAYPVMIGTRDDHVAFDPTFCQLNQLNHLVCYVGTDDSTGYPLDPGDETAMYPFAGTNDLVEGGVLIDGKQSRPIIFNNHLRKSGTDYFSSIYVRPDGSALCSTKVVIRGFAIAKHQTILHDSLSQERIIERLLGNSDVKYRPTGATFAFDSEEDKLVIMMLMELPTFATVIESTAFFAPCSIPLEDNPFTSDIRVLPVDFQYPFSNRHRIRVLLPEKWQVVDQPIDISQSIPGALLSRKIITTDNRIEIEAILKIDKEVFGTDEYPALKGLFTKAVASYKDQLVATITSAINEGEE